MIRYIILLFFISSIVMAEEITMFTSDGCSVFPDGTLQDQSLWVNCCIRHDFSYWKGGTYAERLNADKELELCVSKIGQPEIAKVMLLGVRAGGSPYFPSHFRWGYGWPYPRGYKALSEEEKVEAKEKITLSIKLLQSFSEELK